MAPSFRSKVKEGKKTNKHEKPVKLQSQSGETMSVVIFGRRSDTEPTEEGHLSTGRAADAKSSTVVLQTLQLFNPQSRTGLVFTVQTVASSNSLQTNNSPKTSLTRLRGRNRRPLPPQKTHRHTQVGLAATGLTHWWFQSLKTPSCATASITRLTLARNGHPRDKKKKNLVKAVHWHFTKQRFCYLQKCRYNAQLREVFFVSFAV